VGPFGAMRALWMPEKSLRGPKNVSMGRFSRKTFREIVGPGGHLEPCQWGIEPCGEWKYLVGEA